MNGAAGHVVAGTEGHHTSRPSAPALKGASYDHHT